MSTTEKIQCHITVENSIFIEVGHPKSPMRLSIGVSRSLGNWKLDKEPSVRWNSYQSCASDLTIASAIMQEGIRIIEEDLPRYRKESDKWFENWRAERAANKER